MSLLGYVSRPRIASVRGCAWDSRLGGLPSFFEAPYAHPTCGRCGRALFLVLQLYSPTELERTLHVWGCNSSRCNRASRLAANATGAWVVRRSQGGAAPAPAPAAAVAPAAAATSGAWGDAGDWGDGVEAEAAGAPELTELLHALPIVETPPSVAAAAPQLPPPPSPLDVFCFPAFEVATCEEAHESGGAGLSGDGEEEEDDDDELGAGGAGGDAAATAHARALYTAYQRSEAALTDGAADGGDGTRAGAAREGGDDDGDSDSSEGAPTGGGGGGRSSRRGTAGDGGGGGIGVGGGGERYEQVPERVRYALRFQSRIAQLPSQVVRYSYAGEPSWPCVPWKAPPASAAAPSQARHQRAARPGRAAGEGGGINGWPVPPCASCGSPRVFELQIMPHALTLLRVDELTAEALAEGAGTSASAEAEMEGAVDREVVQSSSGSRAVQCSSGSQAVQSSSSIPQAVPTLTAATQAAGGEEETPAAPPSVDFSAGGMDWATVLVYVCPLACDGSRDEVAVVVPEV